MIRRFGPALLVLQFFTDMLVALASIKIAELVRLHVHLGFERRDQFVSVRPEIYAMALAVWASCLLLFGVYDRRRKVSLGADLSALWMSSSIATLVLSSLFYLLTMEPPRSPSRLFLVYFYFLMLAFLTLAHMAFFGILALVRRHGHQTRSILIVGGGVLGRHVAVRLRGLESAGVKLCGYVGGDEAPPVPGLVRLGDLNDLADVVRAHDVQDSVIALPSAAHTETLTASAVLQDLGVNVRVLPDVFEMVAMKAQVESFFGLPLISITEPSISPMQGRVKRLFDVFFALVTLILVSPILLIIAIAIKYTSRGPILIHQRRVGAHGRTFAMHKFRSMHWRPDQIDAVVPKQRGDPRVTDVGRFIRRTSLDELPQLWNVLVGEMSLVGPRPELPAIVSEYEPWQLKRLAVPPGMTGWWQVNGRSEQSMHRNTEIDLYYVQNYSILLDIQILVRTLGAVIRGKGAY